MANKTKIVGINFDHMHMGDLLKQALNHPEAEVVGVADDNLDRVYPVLDRLGLSRSLATTDWAGLLNDTKPDLAILCPATAQHGEWTEKVIAHGVHVLVEKPFAASLAEADRMIAAAAKAGKQLFINWPLRWYPTYLTAKRLIDEGAIGKVIEVHTYGGNRGPLRHVMDKIEMPEADPAVKSQSWWYQKQHGGGSLLDYLGYGVTLGTWFMDGRSPLEVTAVVDDPAGLEVDEHSIVICKYETGLSKFETRWGTFTDPWVTQPQPRCGFVMVGTEGTLSAYDYDSTVRIQTRDHMEARDLPVDTVVAPNRDPIEYFIHIINNGLELDGPISTKIARIGQQIIDSAVLSAAEKRTVKLLP